MTQEEQLKEALAILWELRWLEKKWGGGGIDDIDKTIELYERIDRLLPSDDRIEKEPEEPDPVRPYSHDLDEWLRKKGAGR